MAWLGWTPRRALSQPPLPVVSVPFSPSFRTPSPSSLLQSSGSCSASGSCPESFSLNFIFFLKKKKKNPALSQKADPGELD